MDSEKPPLRTCVLPEGCFIYGIHKPGFSVRNLRQKKQVVPLGVTPDGRLIDNRDNFPDDDVTANNCDWIYEIPNAFPFKGCTLIARRHATHFATCPEQIAIAGPPPASPAHSLGHGPNAAARPDDRLAAFLNTLPAPLQLALATTSKNARELALLARQSCTFTGNADKPSGLVYDTDVRGTVSPRIHDRFLYDAVANNPHLPDPYKHVMVLKPGAQGNSPIVGEWNPRDAADASAHIYEYLRTNSYIPWGHYASNLADDTTAYHIDALTPGDMQGLRHLYYQRTCVRMAECLGLPLDVKGRVLTPKKLEQLRRSVYACLTPDNGKRLSFCSTIWGWNYGFDLSASRYRLNASHQQIHQQYAMVPGDFAVVMPETCDGLPPEMTPGASLSLLSPYACGDLIADFVNEYAARTRTSFFEAYIKAILSNQRIDGNLQGPQRLVIYSDANVMLFVPKAQTSQWELQLLPLTSVGHVLEADAAMRASLDRAIWLAVTLLAKLGATLITTIEYGRRFDDRSSHQRLLYCFLPRLPMSPGAFSEAQNRWISRHYPEDFAEACRRQLAFLNDDPSGTSAP